MCGLLGLLAKFIETAPFWRWDIRFVKITQMDKGGHQRYMGHCGFAKQHYRLQSALEK